MSTTTVVVVVELLLGHPLQLNCVISHRHKQQLLPRGFLLRHLFSGRLQLVTVGRKEQPPQEGEEVEERGG